MSSTHFTVNADNACLLFPDVGASDASWAPGRLSQPSPPLNSVGLQGNRDGGGNRKPDGKHSHSAIATSGTEEAQLVHGAPPSHASITDYKLAHDTQLLTAARSADGRAFAELSSRYGGSVHKRIFRILRNREDAEDAVQEALIKAYTHLGEFRGSCTFSTWLTSIAINSALMVLRKRRSHSEVSLDQSANGDQERGVREFADSRPDAERLYARRQAVDLLSAAAERLPLCYRGVVEKYHGQEQSLKEAANGLGISEAAAKSRLLRARQAMRSTLKRKRVSAADAW